MRAAADRPSRLRILQPGRPDRWLTTLDPEARCGVSDRIEEAHVAPYATLHELARLMREFARLSETPLDFAVEDA